MKKIIGYNLIMCSLGIIVFVALALLVQWRVGQYVSSEAELQGGMALKGAQTEPIRLNSLKEGLLTSLLTATQGFQKDQRAQAVHAIDAALRVAEVGHHASDGLDRFHFEGAIGRIKKARVALQNGNVGGSVQHLEDLQKVLRQIDFSGSRIQRQVTAFGEYEGAKVITTQGARVGEVKSIEVQNGQPMAAFIRMQGKNDYLGFIDLGGPEVRIPAEKMIIGPRKTLGARMVAIQIE